MVKGVHQTSRFNKNGMEVSHDYEVCSRTSGYLERRGASLPQSDGRLARSVRGHCGVS